MRIIKILLAAMLAGLVLAVLLTAVCIRLYLTPENIRDSVRACLEQHLGRPVTIAAAEQESLRRITLRDLTIHAAYPWEPAALLACPEVSVRIGLLPLIAKRLLIQEIIMHAPAAELYLPPRQPLQIFGPGGAARAPAAVLSAILLPERFLVRNGGMRLADPQQGALIELESLSIDADNLSLVVPCAFSGSARIVNDPGARIGLSGTAVPLRRTLTADISLEGVRLEQLSLLAERYGIPLRQGRLSGTAAVITDFTRRLGISGSVDIRDAELDLIPPLQMSLRSVPAGVRFRATYDFAQHSLILDSIEGTLLSAPFSGSGTISSRGGAARFSGTLQAPAFSLDTLFARLYLPPDSPLSGLRLGGSVDVTARIDTDASRSASPLVVLRFNGNELYYPGLGTWVPSLRGSVDIDARTIRLTQFTFGSENLSITLAGDIAGYQSWPPRSNITIVSSRADFEEMFAGEGPGDEIGPFALGSLAFSGPINLGSIVFLGMRLDAVQGLYALENSTLRIQDFGGSLAAGGRFSLQVTADLGVRGLDYHAHLRLTDASLEPLKALFPGAPPGLLQGAVSGTCALKGAGTNLRVLPDTLRGDADLLFTGIDLAGMTVLPELSRFIRPEALDSLGFSKAQIQLFLRGGVIDLTGYLAGQYLELYPQGEIGLDASLNLSADLLLSPDIFSDTMNIARYLPRRGNKISLPVTIRGTLAEPRLGLAEETMQYLIRETLPRLLMDIISAMQEEYPEAGAQE